MGRASNMVMSPGINTLNPALTNDFSTTFAPQMDRAYGASSAIEAVCEAVWFVAFVLPVFPFPCTRDAVGSWGCSPFGKYHF